MGMSFTDEHIRQHPSEAQSGEEEESISSSVR